MKVRSLCALIVSMALIGAGTARAAIDKAVYHDPAVGLSWQNADAAQAIEDYFKGQGYTVVDAPGLATWMQGHITAGDTSVVIFDTDLMPDTVMDPDANTDPTKGPTSIFNQYLQTGGKVVYLADWPAYYLVGTDGTKTTWNDTGAASALGFAPSVWGYTDYSTPTIFTDEGKKWGLTKPWLSLRAAPTNSSAFGLILGNPSGHPEAAMPWVKMYVGRPGSGFTYMYDHPTTATEFTPEDLKQIQSVAEYFPKGEVMPDATVNVTLTDAGGKAVAGSVVKMAGDEISVTGTTDTNGKVSFKTIAGTFAVGLGGTVPADPTSASVTVASGASMDVALQEPPSQDVSSAGGVKWQIKLPATEEPADMSASPKPTDDPKSIPTAAGFVDINVPDATAWDDIDATDNIYGWYRAHVTLSDALAGKDLVFGGWNLDDEDWTYWNGQLIGHTNSYNTIRQYLVPASLVQKENDIVILGRDGTGGGGLNIVTDIPKLSQVRPFATVTGTVKDTSGNPANYVSVTVSGTGQFGPQSVGAPVDASGNFSVTGLGPGTYQFVTSGGTRGTTHAAPQTLTLTGDQTATATATVTPPALPDLVAPTDKAVYYDAAQTVAWIADASAQKIRDFLKDKGYTVVDAAGLADFMKAHVMSKTPSVVVTANDIFPSTVVDTSSGGVVATGNALRDYLDAGGRVVYSGDIPVYNVAQPDDTNITPGDNGAITVLGFNTSPGGRDVGDKPVLTAAGMKMGLSDTWQRSLRPALPNDVDVVLASSQNNTHAAGWIRFYPDAKGPGAFIRWIDATEDDSTYTIDSILPDIQKLAEFAGNLGTGGGGMMMGTLGDLNGDGKVDIKDATLSLQIAVGSLQPMGTQTTTGDANKDGKLDLKDTTLILGAAVGIRTL